MRLSLLRATFLAPVFSSKTLTADTETVLEFDEARGLVFVTRRGVERFTPIANLVEAEEPVPRVVHTASGGALIGPAIGPGYGASIAIEEPPAKPRRARTRRSDSGPATS
jgi:hypothetical protein